MGKRPGRLISFMHHTNLNTLNKIPTFYKGIIYNDEDPVRFKDKLKFKVHVLEADMNLSRHKLLLNPENIKLIGYID